MADECEAMHCRDETESRRLASDPTVSSGDDSVRVLRDIVQELPSYIAKDLSNLGVCVRCIIRLCGIEGHSPCFLSLTSTIVHLVQEIIDVDDSQGADSVSTINETVVEPHLCTICVGILQFTYCNDREKLVKNEGAEDFAVSIAEMAKQQGYKIDSFSLEVSIPPIVLKNEESILQHLKIKYGSDLWFTQKAPLRVSVKDALMFSITKPLETLLHSKSNTSVFRLRLTYSHQKSSMITDDSMEHNQVCKKLKADTENRFNSIDGATATSFESSGTSACEFSNSSKPFPEKMNEPFHLAFICLRTPIYFVGRYLKYSRNVSQSRWIIDDERMGEASVEETLGSNILHSCRGDTYKFHAAGREDIDVRMLGSGRPFLIQIHNPRVVPSEIGVKEIEMKINNLEKKLVGIKSLKIVGSEGWALMREGEAEKQKQYAALVWISRPLEDKDNHLVSSLKDMQILQRTPIRVLHRRSPLDRGKIIHWMKIERVVGSSQYFLLHLCTQAGTYIKEFVHGDLGRTHPRYEARTWVAMIRVPHFEYNNCDTCITTVGSLLGCRAEILQLDVTDVNMSGNLV